MNTIPPWVVPGADAVLIGGRSFEKVTELKILRVGKKYAILPDGSRFDATSWFHHDLSLRRSTGTWSPAEYLYSADSDTARVAVAKKAIGRTGKVLEGTVAAFIKEPTEGRAATVKALVDQIVAATWKAS